MDPGDSPGRGPRARVCEQSIKRLIIVFAGETSPVLEFQGIIMCLEISFIIVAKYTSNNYFYAYVFQVLRPVIGTWVFVVKLMA